MSFYRTLLATVAAVVIAGPVLAEDTTTTTGTTETTTMQTTENTSGQTDGKVNINKATFKQLKKIGLKPAQAKAILSYRKTHGDFKTTEEIANVKALKKLSPETLKTITDQLTVE